jgi:hypothetical protein
MEISDEEEHERLRQQFLDSNEIRSIILEELEIEHLQMNPDELITFFESICRENEEFIHQDEGINWKLLNLDAPSDMFDQTQPEIEEGEMEDDHLSREEELRTFWDEMSSYVYSAEGLNPSASYCPFWRFVLQYSNDGVLVCESDNCIQLNIPIENFNATEFSNQVIEMVKIHSYEDDCQPAEGDMSISVFNQPEDGIQELLLNCNKCKSQKFINF